MREVYSGGVDKVLELVGPSTMRDSLLCTKHRGIVCGTGMVGNQFSFRDFSPMEVIPTAVSLTCYTGGAQEFMETPLQDLVDQIAAETLHVQIGRTYPFDDIVAEHRAMDQNKAGGKIVMLM